MKEKGAMALVDTWGLAVGVPADSAGAGAKVVGHCFAPDAKAAAELPRPIWLFAIHGAGEDWMYWDKVIPGHENEGYSLARFMTDRGVGTIAIDALGCGESEFPFDGSELTLDRIALGHHEAALAFRDRLVSGTLLSGLAPIKDLFYCGLGHSGGAAVTMYEQGQLATYDGIVVLSMPAADFKYPGRGEDALRAAIHTDEKGMIFIPVRPPQSVAGAFYPGTPQDIQDAFPPGRPFPPSHLLNMREGTLAPKAANVKCPVFTGFGEVDLAGSPLQEQQRFGSSDVTAYVQPGSYHHIIAAPKRHEFMTAIYNWAWSRAKYTDR
jgi:alpha-beta hydrolase superfamily lysophospholipase